MRTETDDTRNTNQTVNTIKEPIAVWAVREINDIIKKNGGVEKFPLEVDPDGEPTRCHDYADGSDFIEPRMKENSSLTELLKPIREVTDALHVYTTIANGLNKVEIFNDGSVNALGDIQKQFATVEDAVAAAKNEPTGVLANMIFDVTVEPLMFSENGRFSPEWLAKCKRWSDMVVKHCRPQLRKWKSNKELKLRYNDEWLLLRK
jgi:hypothetical protein